MAKSKTVDAAPTKQFFVRMLTRDIELLDAILDLLDNCIDGIIRSSKSRRGHESNPSPYDGYFAEITATPTAFSIRDNCGGIPRDVAEKVAFRLGRPNDDELESLGINIGKQGTVGLYGIGMKRAVFKMGRHAVVSSENGPDSFAVEITPEWLSSGEWNLPLRETTATGEKGTRVSVDELYPEVAHQFTGDTPFLQDLVDAISQLFAVIIGKGFVVKLNGREVKPVTLKLLVSGAKVGEAINPYVFEGELRGVAIKILVGFHRDPSKSTEKEDEEAKQAGVRQAGWSVICNDRLVLYGDKTEMSGWGTRQVPYFHPQYNSIAGIVFLKSDDPALLPLNTTKRGIEIGAAGGVYMKVLDYMKEGVKRFTDYTNKWKGRLPETAPQFRTTKAIPVGEIPRSIPSENFKKVGKTRLADESAHANEFRPELPLPPTNSTTQRISFSKPIDEVQEVAEALFDDRDVTPAAVGEECFNRTLASIRKPKKRP